MKKTRTTLRLDQLQLNEGQLDWLGRNPRIGTQEDIDKCVASLKEDPDWLDDKPLSVVPAKEPDQYVVFIGNLRTTSAPLAGLTELPAIIYEPEKNTDPDKGGKLTFEVDRETVRRRALKDNGTFGHWDYDELPNWGVDAEQLKKWGVETPEGWDVGAAGSVESNTAQEDDFDENTDEIHVVCKRGDIWQLGEHRLMCGDSIDLQEVNKLMGGGGDKCPYNGPAI